ncbi:hypothetical protein BH10CYA1_BH10CYA1_20330 [soil metagenome]
MEINGWPRHQLRAQGRLRCDPRIGYRKAGTSELAAHAPSRRTDSNDSATRSTQLLNFLAKTASHIERDLLQNAAVPDFALVKNSIKPDFDINDLVARKRRSMVPDLSIDSIVMAREVAAEGLLGRLADTIADAAINEADREHDYEHDFAIAIGAGNEGHSSATGRIVEAVSQPSELDEVESLDSSFEDDHSIFTPLSVDATSSSAFELNEWFNCLFDPTDGDSEFPIEFKPELSRPPSALLPAALPPFMPSIDTDVLETAPAVEVSKPFSARHKLSRRRERGKLFRRLVIDQPRIACLPGGERVERFDNGAELKKDALGRVRHIRSGLGVSIAVAYDSEGQPQGFVRSDRHGQMHSIGERDRHGVVVRDIEGRVRAAGESMSVDPSGCLSVRRFDGQFWSLDLVKELHIERRSIVGRDGSWNFLTALFTSDGFRMMTRFQSLQCEDGVAGDRFQWLAAEPSGTFRFYGRDGSVIEFEGEDHLTLRKPQKVWAPGSRAIDPIFRGHHQAGTAWDSVQEYITSYLSA